jgi:tRNA (mo5U34)-methyltransferase
VVPRYIEQARLVKRALGRSNLEFEVMPLEDLDPARVGRFDVTLCFGILYHLENPVLGLRRIAEVTDGLIVVETALVTDRADEPYWRMDIVDPVDLDDRVASTGLWRTEKVCQLAPTARAIEDVLGFLGFEAERLEPPPDSWEPFLDGRRAAFLGRGPGAVGRTGIVRRLWRRSRSAIRARA